MKSLNITEGSILKVLLKFAFPFFVANILQSLYGAVDLFVIGKFCSAESVAAVSTGTQVTQIITSLITGFTLGSTILIGQYTGKQDMKRVKETIGTTLTLFAGFALLLTAVMLLVKEPLLQLLQTPAPSFALTVTYVQICSLGIFFICGYNAISAILRGYGDSVRPMLFVGLACIINIVLDYIFVKFLRLDVAGTALATIISQGISMFSAVVYLKIKKFIFDFRLKSFRPVLSIAKELAVTGIPISFQELLIRISFLYLMAVMNHCGVAAAAVVGISSKYDVFAMLPATAMAGALAAITAQNIGAGKPARARKSLWYGLGIALSIAACFLIWAQVSPASMIGVFSDDKDIIAAGIPFFRSCSFDYVMVTFVFCLNGYLNGKQKTLWTMLSSSFGALFLRIPLVWYAGRHFADDLRMLGKIAPFVSGIMAVYTLLYVLLEGKRKQKKHGEPVL